MIPEPDTVNSQLVILRQAALDLQGQKKDGLDLVRVAGILSRIRTWWKSFSPEFAERQKKLETEYAEVKPAIQELLTTLNSMEAGFKDQDPDAVAQAVEVLPGMISQVSTELGKLNKSVTTTSQAIPPQWQSPEHIRYVQRGFKEKPEILERLKSQLPSELVNEVPIGDGINRPLGDFNWFKHYGPDTIAISPKVLTYSRNELKNLLKTKAPMSEEEAEDILVFGWEMFLDNWKKSLFENGILVKYYFGDVSEKSHIQNRPVNQMEMTVNVGRVRLPAPSSSIYVDCAGSVLHDLGASRAGSNFLTLWKLGTLRLNPATVIKQSQDGILEKLVKKHLVANALPLTTALIVTDNTDKKVPEAYMVRFAKVLSSALRQELSAECSSVHSDGDNVIEIETDVYGSPEAVESAVTGIANGISEAFEQATGFRVKCAVTANKESSHELISSEAFNDSFRKIALETWSRYV